MHPPPLHVVTPCQVRRLCDRRGPAAFLSPEELERYLGFGSWKRRRDWLAGRVAAKTLLRRALRRRRGVAPALKEICVRNAPDGAPFLVLRADGHPEPGWSISIAHAEGYGVCALSPAPGEEVVGVDLERERPLRPETLRYFLALDERRRLERTARSSAAPSPIALWALKEAVLKAGRDVPCTSLRQVGLRWDDRGAVTATLEGRHGRVPIEVGYRVRASWVLAYALCDATGAR